MARIDLGDDDSEDALADALKQLQRQHLIVLDELRRVSGAEQREELGKQLRAAALTRLGCGRLDKFDALIDMVYAMRACEHLPLIEKDDSGRKLAAWLLDHPVVSRLLFRALGEVKSPKKALERFRELQAAEEQAVLAYPNLAVAFATSEELRHYRKSPKPASLVESFRYYTDAKRKFRYDLKKMPFELSRYLADTRIDVAERQWAAKRYARSRNPAGAFFHVKYDDASYHDGKPKKIADKDYTLQNLARYGGVCIDQAYYANEVCKALGIPSTIVSGRGGTGISHAWVAFFQLSPSGKEASWNAATGRYSSQLYYTGGLRNPADGKEILDAELKLLGSAALLAPRRREEADAATVLARLVDDAGEVKADLGPLMRLAETYRQRFAGKPGNPALATKWINAETKVDSALAEELIMMAIQRNLAHKEAWNLVVAMRRVDRLPVDHLDRFFNILIQKTAKVHPEYSCLMILEIVPTLPETEPREKSYRRSLAVYGRRPDLRGRLLIALGDEYRQRGDKKKALRTYQSAAIEGIQLAEVVLAAAGKAEELLTEAKQPKAAMRMYQMLFRKTRKSRAHEETRKATSHYQLGQRLATLLQSAGQVAAAERIRGQL